MGNSSTKPAEHNQVRENQINEEGGLHLLEFHLPSAGYGFIFIVCVIALCMMGYIVYRRCIVEPKKKKRAREVLPLSTIYRYQAGLARGGFDDCRFEDVTPPPNRGLRQPEENAGARRIPEAV